MILLENELEVLILADVGVVVLLLLKKMMMKIY
jgi:hypothetical protein